MGVEGAEWVDMYYKFEEMNKEVGARGLGESNRAKLLRKLGSKRQR